MKHQFYFTGYSDDVVLAGHDECSFDEHYGTFFLMSNGLVIKAEYGKTGWSIAPTTEAAGVTVIEAVDKDDSGDEHTDPRIPDWFEAPGYAPVCIIEADELIEIISASRKPFRNTSPEFIAAARLRNAVIKAADCDEGECPSVEAFLQAMKAGGTIKI